MGDVIESFADVPEGRLYYRTRGVGRDVLLLNAGAADLRMWDSTIAWLAGIAWVTTFDYRDTGLSSQGTRPYSELDDIAAVMDAARVSSAVLIGVSDGARRALAFAHRHPERVSRVVAVGGSFGEFPDPTPEESAARQAMLELFARRAEVMAKQAPQATLEVLEGADHFPMLSAPGEFERIVRQSL